MQMDILVATALQLTLGSILLTKMLSLPNCLKLKHRIVSLGFAVLGSVTITTGIFYYPEFSWIRTISLTFLTLACLILLTYSKWSIPKVCYRLQIILKRLIHI